MDLNFTEQQQDFQKEVRGFLDEHLDAEVSEKVKNGISITKGESEEWHNKLNNKGWLAGPWPKEFGGQNWGVVEKFIFEEECGASGAPRIVPFGVGMLAPVLMKFGSEKQRKHWLPRMLTGEDWWCQGYSEPGSGSDLASLSTKAEEIDGSYIINGTKTWTTLAQHADMMFILVRTNSDCKPQEGISFMLLDMKSPGVSVKPIITLDGGHEVNMVYLENVKVPKENLIYEENKGWTVAKYLLGHERTSIAAVSRSKKALSKVREIAKLNINGDSNLTDDSRFMDKVTKCDVRLQALEYAELKSISDDVKGIPPGPEASMLKIRGSEIQQEITELVLEASGYYANPYQPNIMDIGNNEPLIGPEWSSAAAPKYFNTRKTTIYGGSNEIQKNILAKMVLEL